MPAGKRPDAKNGVAGKACYVYGIVPEDVELDPGARGVGEPPGRVGLVRHGDIAALVSDVSGPLRRPGDLLAHQALLDGAAAEVPVLPVRFGSVVADPAAVEEQLLRRHHDDFAAALAELEGRAEYVIEARHAGRGEPRGADAGTIVDAVAALCAGTRVRGPSGDGSRDGSGRNGDEVAVLMDTARQADLERAVGKLARDWDQRAGLRLVGPIAPYDFVVALTPDG
jgi:gas vesicle protein GvpL/GvpF